MTDPLQDPGVQGLAQLGRNAIDRVSQLEAETARLTGCLNRANAQAEHFEREWYLRGEVLDTAEYWLGSLLAVIHRDGGHYEAEHGAARDADDAIAAVHALRGSLEGYVEANKWMQIELETAIEDARKYAEARREITRLRDALGKIAKGRTGLDPEESDAEWRAYWANLCIDYRSMARAALAQVAEVPNG